MIKRRKQRVSGNEAPTPDFFINRILKLMCKEQRICMHDMCNQLKLRCEREEPRFHSDTWSVRTPASVAKVL